MTRPPRRRSWKGAGFALSLLLSLAGCAYFNSLYNARRVFGQAEADRWSGRPSQALTEYEDAIDKAARSFRSDPDGRWADDALVLMGRAYLYRSEWQKGRGALRHALEISQEESKRAEARLYLGAIDVATGRATSGVALLDSALQAVDNDEVRAEGHLWRAEGHFIAGASAAGWKDLDAVGAEGGRLQMAAEASRMGWGVRVGDTAQAFRGAAALVSSTAGRVWADSIAAVADQARRIWGPSAAARLLGGVENAPWPPSDRNRFILARARLAASAGDTAAAIEDARKVSGAAGRTADDARVLEARLRLPGVSEIRELDGIRSLLLPAVGSREAVAILDWMKKVGLMVEEATDRSQSLALFAAAEMARDSLGAPLLAQRLFLVYADRARGDAWEGKALLAALQLTPDPDEKSRLRARTDSLDTNVYVRAWRRSEERELDYTVVERRLATALQNLKTRIDSRAQNRDVLVSETARMLDSIRTEEEIHRRLAEGDSILMDSLRTDSIRRDSIRLDSIRRADSLAQDTAFFRSDSFPPDTGRVFGAPSVPHPVLIPYRPGIVPPPGPDPLLRRGG